MSSLTVRESVANGGIALLFQSTRLVAAVAVCVW